MKCTQFRIRAGAEPERMTIRDQMHRWLCPKCARFLSEMRFVNVQIYRALACELVNGRRSDAPPDK